MAVSFPRISITVEDGNERGTQGELGSLAFGFGIHLTWTFCILFNPSLVFGEGQARSDIAALFFLATIAVFVVVGIFLFLTDQMLLEIYTARPTMLVSACATALGSLMAIACSSFGWGAPPAIAAGVFAGFGGSLFTMQWGTAYSRYNTASIVLNSSVAVVLATLLYSLIIHVLPWPVCTLLAAVVPLLELPFLWRLTPVSYALRHEVPIFNPLPIKKVAFAVLFGIPILLFGVVLGALKMTGLGVILPSTDPTVQLIALFAGGTATIVLLVLSFSTDKHYQWDFLFRPLVPIVGITVLFFPLLQSNSDLLPSLMLLTGFLCLEALMWILPAQLAQELRISPVCMFGIGSTAIALGTVGGMTLTRGTSFIDALPYGDGSMVVVLLVCLMLGLALLPRVRDLKRFIVSDEAIDDPQVAAFNEHLDRRHAGRRASMPPAWSAGLELALGQEPATVASSINGEPPLSYDAALAEELQDAAAAAVKAGKEAPLPTDKESDEARAKVRGRFRTQCEEIANRYLLSRRETEVMFLLAKGHNAAFIQDKLCISKSTAKTHISHIYRKLDIHNQQELLAMVDAARNEK